MEITRALEGECKQIKYDALKTVWFMRGGVSLEEAYEFGPEDRKIVNGIIEENLKTTKETKMPFF